MQRAKGMGPGKLWIPEEGGSLLQKDDRHAEVAWCERMLSGKIGPGTLWNKKPVKKGRLGRDIAQNRKAAMA
jgi:hypothetical protein